MFWLLWLKFNCPFKMLDGFFDVSLFHEGYAQISVKAGIVWLMV